MNPEFLLNHLNRIIDVPNAIPRLRSFILDLAVRGKLVEQDAKDEPASELLKRIKAEKALLTKQGIIRTLDSSKLPAKSEFLFPMPSGWAPSTLQSLCISVTDGDHLPPPKADQGIPFLVIGNVRSRALNFTDCRYVSEQYYSALDPIRRPQKGDILYTLVGSYGIPVIITNDRQFCVQRHIGILRPSLTINARFLSQILESKWVFDQATACATGIAQKTVSLAGLRQILIPLPPFAEQDRIVAKVDKLMALCDRLIAAQHDRDNEQHRLTAASHHHLNNGADGEVLRMRARFFLSNLQRFTKHPDQIKPLRETILRLATRGKLVSQIEQEEPVSILLRRIQVEREDLLRRRVIKGKLSNTSDFQDDPISDIPRSWQWTNLSQLIVFGPQNGISPSASSRPDAPKAITLTATTSGVFKSNHFKKIDANVPRDSELWLRQGDLLFQRGNTREYVGMAAYFEGEDGQFLYPDLIIKVRVSKLVDLRFVHLCSTAPYARAYFGKRATGAQATMPKINHDILLNLPIPLPPLAEQHRIVAKVGELMLLFGQLEAELYTAQAKSNSLLESVLHRTLEAQRYELVEG